MHLLHIDSSARTAGSLTRQLSAEYVAAWQAKHPQGTVTHRDVARDTPNLVSTDWITGVFGPTEAHTAESKEAVEASEVLIREVEAADVLVLGVPTYNFGVPASFKAWIDQVCMAGRTFAYDENGPRGLLSGKKVVVVRSSGSDFGTPASAPMDFYGPYLRGVLGFLGITDVEFIAVHGNTPEQVEAAVRKGSVAIAASLSTAA